MKRPLALPPSPSPRGEGNWTSGYWVDKSMRMNYKKREFARWLRIDQTFYEEKVWQQLRNRKCLGLRFRRQPVLEGFAVDFFCHDLKLAIELDGEVHEKQKDYDELRDEVMRSEDIIIMRISNDEIDRDEKIVRKKIGQYLNQLKG